MTAPRRLPEPLIAWRILNAEMQARGRRGAPARAYRVLRDQGYTMSDQWLYNLFKQDEPSPEDEVRYEPAPGELEYRAAIAQRQRRQARRRTGKPKRVRRPPKTVDTVPLELPTERLQMPIYPQTLPMIMSRPRSNPTLELPVSQQSTFNSDIPWAGPFGLVLCGLMYAVAWRAITRRPDMWWWSLLVVVVFVPWMVVWWRMSDEQVRYWRWYVVLLVGAVVLAGAWWWYLFA